MQATTDQIIRPEWLGLDVYPPTLRTVDVPSGPVSYIDEGQGPNLVFVHAGMWSFIFRDVIARLSSEFRCIALDFPGTGLTDPHEGIEEISDLSAVLGDFITALGLDRVTLVLHDLGGPVGLGAALEAPDRISGLVMANSFAWTPDRTALRAMLRVMGGPTFTGFDVATNLIPRLSSTRFGVGRHLDSPSRAAFLGPFRSRGPRRRFHELMRSVLAHPDHTDRIEVATRTVLAHLPVLSIYGEKNDPFGFQDRVGATSADHEGIIIEKGNHFPMMDDPYRFSTTLAEWHHRRVSTTA